VFHERDMPGRVNEPHGDVVAAISAMVSWVTDEDARQGSRSKLVRGLEYRWNLTRVGEAEAEPRGGHGPSQRSKNAITPHT
jgi:hypothetical protein